MLDLKRFHSFFPSLVVLFVLAINLVIAGCTSKTRFGSNRLIKNAGMVQDRTRSSLEDLEENLAETGMTLEQYERLGDMYTHMGKLDLAFIYYQKALRNSDDPLYSLRYKLGCLYRSSGLLDQSLEVFEDIIKEKSDFAPAWEGKGHCFLLKDNLVQAKSSLQKSLQFDEERWKSHNLMGIIYSRQKKYEQAVSHYQQAHNLNPDSGSICNNLGLAYYMKRDFKKASQVFSEALQKDKTNSSKIFNNLALALAKAHKYEEAFSAFKEAGGKVQAYNNIGYVHLQNGRYEKAYQAFEKAIELSPRYNELASENLQRTKKELLRKGVSLRLEKSAKNNSRNPQRRNDQQQMDKKASDAGQNRSENVFYSVHINSFQNKEDAISASDNLKNLGYNAKVTEVVIPEKGTWYRVMVGVRPSRNGALELAQKLQQENNIEYTSIKKILRNKII